MYLVIVCLGEGSRLGKAFAAGFCVMFVLLLWWWYLYCHSGWVCDMHIMLVSSQWF